MNKPSSNSYDPNKILTKKTLINSNQEINIPNGLIEKDSKNEIILISSDSNNPPSGPEGLEGISPYFLPLGGGTIALVIALTAYSQSQMKSVNELVKTLLKQNKRE